MKCVLKTQVKLPKVIQSFLITITENSWFSFRRNCLSLEFHWWNDWGYKRKTAHSIFRVNHVLSMFVNLSLANRYRPLLCSGPRFTNLNMKQKTKMWKNYRQTDERWQTGKQNSSIELHVSQQREPSLLNGYEVPCVVLCL